MISEVSTYVILLLSLLTGTSKLNGPKSGVRKLQRQNTASSCASCSYIYTENNATKKAIM